MTCLLKPNVSEKLARDLVYRLYGFDVVEIKRLVSYDDQNFHIKVDIKHRNPHISSVCEDGYTLKITNTAKTASSGHFERMHSIMSHLSAKGLRCPVPVSNIEGSTWKAEQVPLLNEGTNSNGSNLCGIHLLTYIPGTTVGSFPYTKHILYQWGQLVANLRNALEDFKFNANQTAHIDWNLINVPTIEPLLDETELDKAILIRRVLKRYQEDISPNMNNFPKGIIHGDCNEFNILATKVNQDEDDSAIHVDGILDFEDVHYGEYVWDIGLSLAYAMLNCTTMCPLEATGHVLAGYLSIRRLNNIEMQALKTCIESRLAQSLVKCEDSFRSDPSNTYLLSTPKFGWHRLRQLDAISKQDLMELWKKTAKEYDIEIS